MKEKNIQLGINLRHDLHQHPELSNEETWTKKALMNFLMTNSDLEVVDRGAWFYAVYQAVSPKGNVGFRADFDAIKSLEENDLCYCSLNKGVAHKCGHDGHAATLAAFAIEISEVGADKNVYFIFQHAEETGDGGKLAAELIDEKNIDEIYAFHNLPGAPLGSLGLKSGTICYASLGIEMSFSGVSAHASEPEKGKNPAFTIADIISALPILSSEKKYQGLVLATVVQVDVGERAFGVSAHEGKLLLTVRGEYESELNVFLGAIEKLASEVATKNGIDMSIKYFDVFPETSNHEESIKKITEIAKKDGYEINYMDALRTSEDFGYYLKKTMGAMIWIGAGQDCPPLHSFDFDFRDELINCVGELFKKLI